MEVAPSPGGLVSSSRPRGRAPPRRSIATERAVLLDSGRPVTSSARESLPGLEDEFFGPMLDYAAEDRFLSSAKTS